MYQSFKCKDISLVLLLAIIYSRKLHPMRKMTNNSPKMRGGESLLSFFPYPLLVAFFGLLRNFKQYAQPQSSLRRKKKNGKLKGEEQYKDDYKGYGESVSGGRGMRKRKYKISNCTLKLSIKLLQFFLLLTSFFSTFFLLSSRRFNA